MLVTRGTLKVQILNPMMLMLENHLPVSLLIEELPKKPKKRRKRKKNECLSLQKIPLTTVMRKGKLVQ